MTATQSLKIGDVARVTGVSIDTVRFYEKERLLGNARRTSGIRRYDSGLLSLRVSSRTSCESVRGRADLCGSEAQGPCPFLDALDHECQPT